jgi:hypothetical protein
MFNGNDARAAKAQELRELARQFRSKADETQLQKYVELMRRSAMELERLAEQIESAIEFDLPAARYA